MSKSNQKTLADFVDTADALFGSAKEILKPLASLFDSLVPEDREENNETETSLDEEDEPTTETRTRSPYREVVDPAMVMEISSVNPLPVLDSYLSQHPNYYLSCMYLAGDSDGQFYIAVLTKMQ